MHFHRVERNEGPLSDDRWSIGLCRSDRAVLQALYDRHFPTIRSHVIANSGTARDAQDIFQEAMAVLWLNAREGRVQAAGPDELGAYLFRVARNKWLDVLRSSDHRHMRNAMDSEDLDMPMEAESDRVVEERLQGLRAAYGRLGERCRDLLHRFYFERKDLTTIAQALGIDEGSIRTIKYRCMMQLRRMREAIAQGTLRDERP